MNFIKRNWKNILLILFVFLFIVKCTSSGNYERRYNKQVEYTEYAVDSLNHVYANSAVFIDSLQNVIKIKDLKITSLESQIEIYKDQNSKLAKKPVIVKIEDKTNNNEQ